MSAVRSLLQEVVDYAGLFPPAGLPMRDAVRRYASYRRGPWAWALGRFVVPAGRLAELSNAAADVLPSGHGAVPWRVTALVGTDAAAEIGEVLAFNARHARPDEGRARVDGVETRAGAVEVTARLFEGFSVAYEVDARSERLGDVLRAVKAAGGVAKLRTGGVTEDVFPGVESVARFLWGCARHDVACKLTAGLHHVVRGEYALTYEAQSPQATMHGLLNVLAAALAARRLARAPDAAPLSGGSEQVPALVLSILAERERGAFSFGGDRFTWRSEVFHRDEVELGRAAMGLSIGSCSFEEPLDEMRALGWLA